MQSYTIDTLLAVRCSVKRARAKMEPRWTFHCVGEPRWTFHRVMMLPPFKFLISFLLRNGHNAVWRRMSRAIFILTRDIFFKKN